jgi:hypothetical protein
MKTAKTDPVEELTAKISGLAPKYRDALGRVCHAPYDSEIYLQLDEQRALDVAGFIELTPGRKSREQPNKFAVVFDAKAKPRDRDVSMAFDRWLLSTLEDPEFKERVRLGHYDIGDNSDSFMSDLTQYGADSGIPKQYAGKVASLAWSDAHSSGYSEVVSRMDDLIEIFR